MTLMNVTHVLVTALVPANLRCIPLMLLPLMLNAVLDTPHCKNCVAAVGKNSVCSKNSIYSFVEGFVAQRASGYR